jgi:hypothetical protein
MIEDMINICQQITVTAGSALAVVIVAAAGRYLIRKARKIALKSERSRLYAVDLGIVHLTIFVSVGRKPRSRKPLPRADQ